MNIPYKASPPKPSLVSGEIESFGFSLPSTKFLLKIKNNDNNNSKFILRNIPGNI